MQLVMHLKNSIRERATNMGNILNISQNEEHEVAELMCLKCFSRWIGVYPTSVPLKNIECKCGATGYVIKTGQTIEEES